MYTDNEALQAFVQTLNAGREAPAVAVSDDRVTVEGAWTPQEFYNAIHAATDVITGWNNFNDDSHA